MWSDPRRASTASGRNRPWVSEISPRVTGFSVIGFSLMKLVCATGRPRASVPMWLFPIHHKSIVERSPTSQTGLRLYCREGLKEDARNWSKSGGSAAALLGIPRVSPQAGECYPQSAGRARYLRGDADRRREVAVLPASSGDFREDGGGGFSADRTDAGPGGATGADGHSGGGDQ